MMFDIEVNAKRPQEFIETVMRIAPTFGGINLRTSRRRIVSRSSRR